MKINSLLKFFLLFCAFHLITITANAQNTKITITSNSISVKQLITEIEKQTDFLVLLRNNDVDVNRTLHLKEKSGDISAFLKEAFRNTDISYEIQNKYIVLTTAKQSASGQQSDRKKISGTITDVKGESIIGANITEKGYTNGVISDLDGKFTLSVEPNAVLVVSYIGYNTQEITVGNQTNLTITLTENAVGLNEVVVLGYQSQKKVDLTGSVASISSEQLMRSTPFSVEQALKGQIAGVQVMNNDGAPGGGITVKIRGASSITAGSAPLFIIDGFPLPVSDDPLRNPLSTISPDAIESISVLKDVSSTAIYGAQGANGVILITTKKGKAGVKEIEVKASVGISNIAHGVEMLGAEDYMKAMMRDKVMDQRWENTDFYPEYQARIWETDPSRFQFYPDFCLQNGIRQNYEVSYRGGTETIQNSTIFSFMDEKGIAINTGYKRFYFQTNNTIKLLPQLSLNTNISFENNTRSGANWTDGNLFNEIQTFSPLIPKEWTFQEIDDNLYYTGKMDNPYRKLKDIDYSNTGNTFWGQAELVYNFHPDWFVKAGAGVRTPKNEIRNFVPITIQRSYNTNGEASYGTQNGLNLRGVAQIAYNKTLNDAHHVYAGGVFETNSYENRSFSQSYTQFNNDLGWEGIYSAQSGNHVTPPSIGYEKNTMISGVLMANYDYKSRYLAKFSVRADASSKFGPENRWGYFPSGALGWRLSEEPFFKSVDWLNTKVSNLKLRLSYGQVGNDQINPYIYAQTLASAGRSGIFDSGVIPALYSNRMVNENIGWEITKEFNAGFDLDMFDNRLNLSMDLYQKETSNMLLNQNLPRLSGFNTVTRNIGSVQNKGIELSIGGMIIDKKDFSWHATVNFSSNLSEVLDLGTENQILAGRNIGYGNSSENVLIKEGYPLGLFYGLQLEGVRNNSYSDDNAVGSSSSPWWYTTQRELPYGFVSFADINGDGIINLEDRTVIGCVNPKFIGGLNTHARYKFVELNLDFSWSYGNDIINGNLYNLMSAGGIDNRAAIYYKDAWFGTNPEGTFTGNGPLGWSGYPWTASNSEMVENGSFLKLNNIGLTIHVPEKLLSSWKFRDISLTYSVNNAFCLTKYSGYDPEISSGGSGDNRILAGVDRSAYPYARTQTVSLLVKF